MNNAWTWLIFLQRSGIGGYDYVQYASFSYVAWRKCSKQRIREIEENHRIEWIWIIVSNFRLFFLKYILIYPYWSTRHRSAIPQHTCPLVELQNVGNGAVEKSLQPIIEQSVHICTIVNHVLAAFENRKE